MAVWSKVQFSNLPSDLRIDAEYYQPEYLNQLDLITQMDHNSVIGLAQVTDGNHFSISDKFCEAGIRYFRGQDLGDFFISDADPIFIPIEEFDKLKRSQMLPNDVLVSIVGTIGSVGYLTSKYGKATGSCKLAIVRAKKVEPEYLAAFFASTVGQNEIQRRIRGTIQMGLILPDLKEIEVPLPSKEIRNKISELITLSNEQNQQSVSLYSQAESMLLSELGVTGLEQPNSVCYTRRFSETYDSNRLDAEFYQLKFEKLLDAINMTGCAKRLGELLEYCDRGLQPDYDDNGEVFVINSKHIGAQFISSDYEHCTGESWNAKKKAHIKQYDVLYYSTGAYIGRTNCWFNTDRAIGSNHVTIIRPKAECHPVYLSLFLNSRLGLMQADKHAHGSAQREVYPSDICNYAIWLPPWERQEKIAELVIQSKVTRDESYSLLEQAKRLVDQTVYHVQY